MFSCCLPSAGAIHLECYLGAKKKFTLTFLGWLCANLMSRNDAYPTKPLLSWRMSNGVTRFAIAVAVLPLLLHLFMILLLNNPITLSQSYQQLDKYNCTIVPSRCTNIVPIANTHTHTQFEPVFNSKRSKNVLQHIILYECQGSSELLQAMSRENGRSCYGRPTLPCNAIVAAWFKGSEVSAFSIYSLSMIYEML